MKPVVLAVGCHPDDIEFMMGGTLFLLKEAGCDCHYMNVAHGNCGTSQYKSGSSQLTPWCQLVAVNVN